MTGGYDAALHTHTLAAFSYMNDTDNNKENLLLTRVLFCVNAIVVNCREICFVSFFSSNPDACPYLQYKKNETKSLANVWTIFAKRAIIITRQQRPF